MRTTGSSARRWLVTGALSIAAAVAVASPALAGSTGTFRPTGSMNLPRSFHSSTLLQNGKVLAAGGFDTVRIPPPFITETAELYNPRTGTWSSTTPMHRKRAAQMTEKLKDGRVLQAGGVTAELPPAPGASEPTELLTNSAEIYDPRTATWTLTPPMHLARADGTATLLYNGTVLVVGGNACEGDTCLGTSPTATAEIYNPRTNSWTWAASMHIARVDHTATGIPSAPGNGGDDRASRALSSRHAGNGNDGGHGNDNNGKGSRGFRFVLVAAGATTGFPATNTAEIYDAQADTWTFTGPMNHLRADQSAVLLPEQDEVLISGGGALVGGAPELYSPTAEIYHVASGTWREIAPMNFGRNDHTLTLLQGGLVLVVGGHQHPEQPQDSAEIFNPETESWTVVASSTGSTRAGHAANLLRDGEVLIAGGLFAPHVSTDTASLYTDGEQD